MTHGLYEKHADSQEGVLHTILNQMSDQHTKEVIMAYAVLLLRGAALALHLPTTTPVAMLSAAYVNVSTRPANPQH